MKKSLLVILLIFSIKSVAQDSKFSLEFNYPAPIDQNFIGKNNNGIIDIAVKYRFWELDFFKIGISLNAGMYKNSKKERIQPINVTTYIYNPNVFTEFKLKSTPRLHPYIGIGYTIINARANSADLNTYNFQNNTFVKSNETSNGVSINIGASYDFTTKIFAQVQYLFIKSKTDGEALDIEYNTNINILKIGMGYRF